MCGGNLTWSSCGRVRPQRLAPARHPAALDFLHERRTQVARPTYGVALTLVATAALTAVLAPFHDEIGLLNAGLLFLLLTLLISGTWGATSGCSRRSSRTWRSTSSSSTPCTNSRCRIRENIVALFVFLGVSVIGRTLLSAAQAEADGAHTREAETQVLLGLSRELIGQTDPHEALTSLCAEVVARISSAGRRCAQRVGRLAVLAFAGGRRRRVASRTDRSD